MKIGLLILMCLVLAITLHILLTAGLTYPIDQEIREPWYEVIKDRVAKESKLKEFVLIRFEDNKITNSEYSEIMAESARIHQESAKIVGEQYKKEYKKFLNERLR